MKQIINIVFLGLSYAGISQTVPVLTLDSIFNRISRQNAALEAFDLNAEAYRYRAEAATAWMAPMAGLGTFMTPYPFQKVMDPADRGNLMLRIEQEIPNARKLAAKKTAIESNAAIETMGKAVLLNTYRAEAKMQYYSWLINMRRLKVVDEAEQLMNMMKKMEEVRLPYNQSLLSNIFKSDARIEENRNMGEMYRGEIAKARGWLNSLMNESGDFLFEIDTTFIPMFQSRLGFDTAMLAVNRKDILQMDSRIYAMQLNIKSMELEKRPNYKLVFDHMHPLGGSMPLSFSVMGMMSIPIVKWSRKMYQNESQAMQLETEAMQKERSAMLSETQGMLYGMQGEIRSMQQRVYNMEQKVIPALQRVFDAGLAAYQENKGEITTLISDWEALVMIKMEVLNEQLKLYQMFATYEKELYL